MQLQGTAAASSTQQQQATHTYGFIAHKGRDGFDTYIQPFKAVVSGACLQQLKDNAAALVQTMVEDLAADGLEVPSSFEPSQEQVEREQAADSFAGIVHVSICV